MDVLVAYYSKFGNTQLLAEAIGEEFGPKAHVRLVGIEQLRLSDFERVDLVVMGCPTHRMNFPEEVKLVFNRLTHRILHKTPAAAFDTSYQMSGWLTPFTASKKLASRLHRLGGRVVTRPLTFYVSGRQGPLWDGEIERAREWAGSIFQMVFPADEPGIII